MKPSLRSLVKVLGTVWDRLPPALQRLGVALHETSYKVSVVAVILDEHDRVLLLEHVFRSGEWGLLGGFVARGEQPEDALRREAREEVGLELSSIELSSIRSLPTAAWMMVVFVGRSRGVPVPDGFEINAARWFTLAELPVDLEPEQRALICFALGREKDAAIPARA